MVLHTSCVQTEQQFCSFAGPHLHRRHGFIMAMPLRRPCDRCVPNPTRIRATIILIGLLHRSLGAPVLPRSRRRQKGRPYAAVMPHCLLSKVAVWQYGSSTTPGSRQKAWANHRPYIALPQWRLCVTYVVMAPLRL